MKFLYSALFAAALLAGSIVAQQAPSTTSETAPDSKMKEKMAQMKDKMKAKMSGMMGQATQNGAASTPDMEAEHREMAQLVAKLAQSLGELEAEHDHAKLTAKLAEHRKLVEQLQAHVAKHDQQHGDEKAVPPPAEAAPAAVGHDHH